MKKIVLIETDNQFVNYFERNLINEDLHLEYTVIVIDPSKDAPNNEGVIPLTIEKFNSVYSKELSEIALVLVDIEIFSDSRDKFGIEIAKQIKINYSHIPVISITYHFDEESLPRRFADAVLSINDGVLPKSFFTKHFSRARFKEMFANLITKVQSGQSKGLQSNAFTAKKPEVDFAIITALYDKEFEHVRKCFRNHCEEIIKGEKRNFYKWTVNDGDKKRTIVAAYQSQSGMIDAAILATELILKFNPKYLIMTGVCGGKDDPRINFGDIVVASKVFTFQKGKLSNLTEENTGKSVDLFETELEEITLIDDLSRFQPEFKSIKEKIVAAYKQQKDDLGESCDLKLNIHVEPMACSTFVINKAGYFEEKISIMDRKTVAVEMESYGVARACKILSSTTIPIIVKSVMDKTKEKNDNSKPFAAYTSAQFIKHLIEDNILH